MKKLQTLQPLEAAETAAAMSDVATIGELDDRLRHGSQDLH